MERVDRSATVFFPNLDGLRFFAFLLVYLQHGFGGAFIVDENRSVVIRLVRNAFFDSGWLGVSFFFVLSGFLITYLILSEIKLKGKVDVLAFYARRILRIWPLYYVVILVAFVAYPVLVSLLGFSIHTEARNPIYYLFFLGNFDVIKLGPGQGAMMTSITWSVAIEEQFYLCWPVIFFLFPVRTYKYVFPAVILVSGLFRFYNLQNGMVLYFHSLSVISDMAVGGITAYLAINSERFRQLFAGLSRRLILAVYCLGLSIIILREYIFVQNVSATFSRLVLSVFFAFILTEQNYSEHSLFKIKRLKLISKLGIYTYGLYLIHPIAITLLNGGLKAASASVDSFAVRVAVGVAGFALTVMLAYLSYERFEKKFLRLKQRFSYVLSGA